MYAFVQGKESQSGFYKGKKGHKGVDQYRSI